MTMPVSVSAPTCQARSRAISVGVAVMLAALLCACAQKGGSSAGGPSSGRSGDAASTQADAAGTRSGRPGAPGSAGATDPASLPDPWGDHDGDGVLNYEDEDYLEEFAAWGDHDGDGVVNREDPDFLKEYSAFGDHDGDGVANREDPDFQEKYPGFAGMEGGSDVVSSRDGDGSGVQYGADGDGMDGDSYPGMAGADGADGSDGSMSGPGGRRRGARAGATGQGAGGEDGSSLGGDADAADGQAGGRRSGRRTARAGDAADEDGSMVVGLVDAPGSRVRVDEEVTAQTLGGMLPLVLGVDEQGEFDFDQAVLRPDVKEVLDELAFKLEDAEYDRLDIVGYTDRIGSHDYNQGLSERRAWAVARYLMDKGVPLDKLKVEGRGARESLLQESECADLTRDELIACLQRDRRVQIEASIVKSHARVQ